MQTYLFAFLGGLALFIYGMHLMGDGLQKAAGEKMQHILSMLTSFTVAGVLMGALVTAVIQSSSATTVMTVGLVNAGLLTLKQAFSIIMGANIGTTMTAQLIAFKLTAYVKLLLAIGFAINFLAKKNKYKYFGQVLLGFGILMLGMEIMGDAVSPLRQYQGFIDFIQKFSSNPILGVLVGIFMTVVIQSSSATIGILMTMSAQGLIPLEGAIPVLLGDNIGTCITAVFATVGANITAKRTALAHVLFNVIGTMIFIIFMNYFMMIVAFVSPENDVVRQIANAHTAFNVINALIFIPFAVPFVNFVAALLPGQVETISKKPIYLDTNMLSTSVVAISLATKETVRMANLAKDNLLAATAALFDHDNKKIRFVLEYEPVIDSLEKDITIYLTQISSQITSMSDVMSKRHTALLHTCNDIERVGDHAQGLIKEVNTMIENDINFSEQALIELKEIGDMVALTYTYAIEALEKDDKDLAQKSIETSTLVRSLHKNIRRNHVTRLNDNQCSPIAGFVLIEILINLKRVSDHSRNIAQLVTGNF